MASSRELTVSIKRALRVLATSGTLLIPSERRINTGDSLKSGMGVENKRHTNVHQPLTSQSPIGATMPQIIREMIVLLRSEATQYQCQPGRNLMQTSLRSWEIACNCNRC
jgi:hypothetical protein